MNIEPGQIYFAPIELKQAKYARPFIVLRILAGEAIICCMSTKFELKQSTDLTLHSSEVTFPSTGLKEDSYLVFRSIHAEPLELFQTAKWLGCVEGDVKRRVEEWWGEPLG